MRIVMGFFLLDARLCAKGRANRLQRSVGRFDPADDPLPRASTGTDRG
jgi:hypothetical protein